MQGKAEDAGGLTPTKDDNEAMRKSGPKANAIFWLDGVLGLASWYINSPL